MNDDFRALKERLRRLDAVLLGGGPVDTELAQALSKVRRAAKRGDRTRSPTPELRALLERAEMVARRIA